MKCPAPGSLSTSAEGRAPVAASTILNIQPVPVSGICSYLRWRSASFFGLSGPPRCAVIAGSALSLPAILAACGIGPGNSPGASGGSQAALPSAPAGVLDFANWPAYIDIDEESGDYPTLAKFTDDTGIEVTYTEAINDNEEFFGTIQPDLAAGVPGESSSVIDGGLVLTVNGSAAGLDGRDQRTPGLAARTADADPDPGVRGLTGVDELLGDFHAAEATFRHARPRYCST